MKDRIITVPNILTLFRIILVPVFAVCYFRLYDMRWIALLCFGVACLTDVLDGYIARRFNIISKVGTAIDPLADKLMYMTVAVSLAISGIIWWPFVAVYAAKELVMISFGIVLWLKNETGTVIPAKWYGKLTTALFFVIIVVSIVYPPEWNILWINLAYIAVLILAVYAFVEYGLIYLKIRKNQFKEQPKE